MSCAHGAPRLPRLSQDGAVTFASFCFFGFFPLAAYCIVGTASEDVDSRMLFTISCILTCVMLFVLGALKSTMTARSWLFSGLEVLMVGSLVDASLDLTNSWCATPKPTMIKKRSPLPSAVQRMIPNCR